jgi:hypothetical protein
VAKPTGLLQECVTQEVTVHSLGRCSRLVLELSVGSTAALGIALVLPLSFWSALGDAGAAAFILVIAASITSLAMLGSRRLTRRSDRMVVSLPPRRSATDRIAA